MTFDLHKAQGLSHEEATLRLKEEGFNELPSEKPRGLLHTILSLLKEPMLLLLLAAGGLYLLLGDMEEALTLSSFVLLVIAITIIQERRTENALAALRDLSSPRASVLREGKEKKIAGREVVRGDLLLLREGDRVPADAWLLESEHLEVDESLLTGESVPVRKRSATTRPEGLRPGGDDLPVIYSGTLLVRGRGVAEAIYTGARTELGKIGKMLTQVEEGQTPLQHEVRRVVKIVALVGVFLCLVMVLVLGLTKGDWLQSFLSGIALAMAVLPEEFPVVLTVFLAFGAWRLSKNRVLTRRMPAVEALGEATILCTDKTGTLTENRMKISRLWSPLGEHTIGQDELPEEVHEVIEFGILASQRDPFDPMEIAFKHLGERLSGTEHLHGSWELVKEYPLSHELLSMSHVWRAPDGARYVIAAKGAPEAIADLCHLSPEETKALSARVAALASGGLRVLAVARAYFTNDPLPTRQHDFDFALVGLVGLSDPLRESVPAAISECKTAGVKVLMITGDSPETAKSIARQAGLPHPESVLTGHDIEAMSEEELRARLPGTSIVARAVPEQKLRIVQALRANGEVVAMTGDGVNDAPALKAAHIGVAMGGRGTDVAREAAALVLTDDNFASIVGAVRLGRRIFDNLRKAMAYIIAVHVPIIGISLASALLGWPMVLFPIHIVTLELIIDPACSIVFEAEPEERGVMQRPPHPPNSPIFTSRLVWLSALQGIGLFLAVLAVFGLSLSLGEMAARTLAFSALIAGNLSLILTNRSWERSMSQTLTGKNTALWVMVCGATLFLALALFVPWPRELFRFSAVAPHWIALSLLAGALGVLWFEGYKALFSRSNHSGRSSPRLALGR